MSTPPPSASPVDPAIAFRFLPCLAAAWKAWRSAAFVLLVGGALFLVASVKIDHTTDAVGDEVYSTSDVADALARFDLLRLLGDVGLTTVLGVLGFLAATVAAPGIVRVFAAALEGRPAGFGELFSAWKLLPKAAAWSLGTSMGFRILGGVVALGVALCLAKSQGATGVDQAIWLGLAGVSSVLLVFGVMVPANVVFALGWLEIALVEGIGLGAVSRRGVQILRAAPVRVCVFFVLCGLLAFSGLAGLVLGLVLTVPLAVGVAVAGFLRLEGRLPV